MMNNGIQAMNMVQPYGEYGEIDSDTYHSWILLSWISRYRDNQPKYCMIFKEILCMIYKYHDTYDASYFVKNSAIFRLDITMFR